MSRKIEVHGRYFEPTEGDSTAPRRDVLKGGMALGGLAATAGMPFWSKFALAQGEELVPFTDVPETFAAPPVVPGGILFQDTRNIDSFYTPVGEFYIVQHYDQPEIAPEDYRLQISGIGGPAHGTHAGAVAGPAEGRNRCWIRVRRQSRRCLFMA